MAAAAGALAACSSEDDDSAGSDGAGVPSRLRDEPDVSGELAAIERRFDGRLGVYAVDTGNGRTVSHNERERFLMTSTAKIPVVASVLGAGVPLDERVPYGPDDLLEYAPVTEQHVGRGMTVAELCEAAITRSDNTAANLLADRVGGPREVTAFLRRSGDRVTRLDRREPELNVADGRLDTTTPAALADLTRRLVFEDLLDPDARTALTGWLKANTTGDDRIKAGLPKNWEVGDKTGSGERFEVNDVAVAWPPRRAPIVIAVYTSPRGQHASEQPGVTAMVEAARVVVKGLRPTS